MTRSGRTPKLARRKAEPTWSHEVDYLYTFGPEVADIAALAGLEPDPAQQWILDQAFGYDRSGRPAAFEVDIIAPRQNLKTATILMLELGWLYVTEEPLIIHSAHELDATEEAFIDLRTRIEDTPKLAKHLDQTKGEKDHPGMMTGNGSWEMHLEGGIRLKYKARRKNAGRALTADKLVLDEGFALEAAMVGSLYPTLTTIFDAQVVMASSAGKLDSAILRQHRERGRAGSTRRQFYAEWGDREPWSGCKAPHCDHATTTPGCALDDEKRWARIMPAWGTRVQPESIRNLRASMPPLEFAREFMVWWEDPESESGTGTLDMKRWARLSNQQAQQPARVVVYVAVAKDGSRSTVAVAGAGTVGRTLVMTRTLPGHSWVVPYLRQLRRRHGRAIVEIALHEKSGASALLTQLEDNDIGYHSMSSTELGRACTEFIEKVHSDRDEPLLEHVGQNDRRDDVLMDDVRVATTRWNGEVELWESRDTSNPITAVVAASGAVFRWGIHDMADYSLEDSIL